MGAIRLHLGAIRPTKIKRSGGNGRRGPGWVLFIDEAYALCGTGNDFGSQPPSHM